MTRARHMRPSGFQAALLLVSLLALFWRAALPAGFMPERLGDGWVVTLCTGQGLVSAAVDDNGAPQDGTSPSKPGDKQNLATSVCAFASLGLPLLPATPATLLAIALAFLLTASPWRATSALRRAVSWLRPPLRAPPVPARA